MSVSESSLEDISVPGWTQVGSIWLSSQPLIDRSTRGFARLSYKSTLKYLDEIGCFLPTAEDVDALRDAAIAQGSLLKPVTLPTQDMLRASLISSGNQAAVDAFRNRYMQTGEWFEEHDSLVSGQMAEINRSIGDGSLVGNIGKLWIAGATKGWARLKGWWTGQAWIQSGVYPATYPPGQHEFHGDYYFDYSSVVVAKRVTPP